MAGVAGPAYIIAVWASAESGSDFRDFHGVASLGVCAIDVLLFWAIRRAEGEDARCSC